MDLLDGCLSSRRRPQGADVHDNHHVKTPYLPLTTFPQHWEVAEPKEFPTWEGWIFVCGLSLIAPASC